MVQILQKQDRFFSPTSQARSDQSLPALGMQPALAANARSLQQSAFVSHVDSSRNFVPSFTAEGLELRRSRWQLAEPVLRLLLQNVQVAQHPEQVSNSNLLRGEQTRLLDVLKTVFISTADFSTLNSSAQPELQMLLSLPALQEYLSIVLNPEKTEIQIHQAEMQLAQALARESSGFMADAVLAVRESYHVFQSAWQLYQGSSSGFRDEAKLDLALHRLQQGFTQTLLGIQNKICGDDSTFAQNVVHDRFRDSLLMCARSLAQALERNEVFKHQARSFLNEDLPLAAGLQELSNVIRIHTLIGAHDSWELATPFVGGLACVLGGLASKPLIARGSGKLAAVLSCALGGGVQVLFQNIRQAYEGNFNASQCALQLIQALSTGGICGWAGHYLGLGELLTKNSAWGYRRLYHEVQAILESAIECGADEFFALLGLNRLLQNRLGLHSTEGIETTWYMKLINNMAGELGNKPYSHAMQRVYDATFVSQPSVEALVSQQASVGMQRQEEVNPTTPWAASALMLGLPDLFQGHVSGYQVLASLAVLAMSAVSLKDIGLDYKPFPKGIRSTNNESGPQAKAAEVVKSYACEAYLRNSEEPGARLFRALETLGYSTEQFLQGSNPPSFELIFETVFYCDLNPFGLDYGKNDKIPVRNVLSLILKLHFSESQKFCDKVNAAIEEKNLELKGNVFAIHEELRKVALNLLEIAAWVDEKKYADMLDHLNQCGDLPQSIFNRAVESQTSFAEVYYTGLFVFEGATHLISENLLRKYVDQRLAQILESKPELKAYAEHVKLLLCGKNVFSKLVFYFGSNMTGLQLIDYMLSQLESEKLCSAENIFNNFYYVVAEYFPVLKNKRGNLRLKYIELLKGLPRDVCRKLIMTNKDLDEELKIVSQNFEQYLDYSLNQVVSQNSLFQISADKIRTILTSKGLLRTHLLQDFTEEQRRQYVDRLVLELGSGSLHLDQDLFRNIFYFFTDYYKEYNSSHEDDSFKAFTLMLRNVPDLSSEAVLDSDQEAVLRLLAELHEIERRRVEEEAHEVRIARALKGAEVWKGALHLNSQEPS